jgi:hypothetical protein
VIKPGQTYRAIRPTASDPHKGHARIKVTAEPNRFNLSRWTAGKVQIVTITDDGAGSPPPRAQRSPAARNRHHPRRQAPPHRLRPRGGAVTDRDAELDAAQRRAVLFVERIGDARVWARNNLTPEQQRQLLAVLAGREPRP